jgi:hypothetical protein
MVKEIMAEEEAWKAEYEAAWKAEQEVARTAAGGNLPHSSRDVETVVDAPWVEEPPRPPQSQAL